jgi:hypothetical protein
LVVLQAAAALTAQQGGQVVLQAEMVLLVAVQVVV